MLHTPVAASTPALDKGKGLAIELTPKRFPCSLSRPVSRPARENDEKERLRAQAPHSRAGTPRIREFGPRGKERAEQRRNPSRDSLYWSGFRIDGERVLLKRRPSFRERDTPRLSSREPDHSLETWQERNCVDWNEPHYSDRGVGNTLREGLRAVERFQPRGERPHSRDRDHTQPPVSPPGRRGSTPSDAESAYRKPEWCRGLNAPRGPAAEREAGRGRLGERRDRDAREAERSRY
jgi:hypothetical protein